MKVQFKIRITLCVLAVFALAAPQTTTARTFMVGGVARDPADQIRKFLPFATYVAGHLRAEGYTGARVVVARDIQQMASFLRDGKVDLHVENYGRTLVLQRLAGSKPTLRRWKKGVAEYHGVIFTANRSGIHQLEDLRGKTIALEEEFSAVGHLLPIMIFMERGLDLVPAGSASSSNGVGYVFAQHDENTMTWVRKGKVSAGVIDGQKFPQEAGGSADSLKILARTPSVPRHVISLRGDLAPDLAARIKEILLGMDRSEEGIRVLRQFERTAKFDELTDRDMALLPKMKKLIETKIRLP